MQNNRPNIIMILSDDHGQWALGAVGNDEILTPYLDRLSNEGVLFENFFCTSPVCSPARASVLTGRIPSAHGVHDWIKGGNGKENPIQYLEGITCYTDILAENGYHCMLSGKWHLGSSFVPQHGFSEWYVHLKGSGDYYYAPMIRNGELETRPEYVTDLITEDAVNKIKAHAKDDNPFYLSVHYTAPHSPWIGQHPKQYTDLYKDCPFNSCPQGEIHPQAVYRYDKQTARECLIGYFAAVTAMDDGIGSILKTLEDEGIQDNTFIIFLGDNGFNCGHHGVWGKGNGTLDLNVYDTSVKVPCIAKWPKKIKGFQKCTTLLSQYDIFQTILEVAGIPYSKEENSRMPGESFLGEITGGRKGKNREIVVFDEYGPVRMIRNDRYKYVHRYNTGLHEFYDLKDDPDEKINRISEKEYRVLIEQMREKLFQWFALYSDPDRDGSKEPVAGNGQLCRCGAYAESEPAFDTNRKATSSSNAGYGQ